MKLEIDFFEYGFLLEACIPPRPIARTWFWMNSVDKHHGMMTKEEREHLFEWISRNGAFTYALSENNEDVIIWQARYNPDNQYNVTYDYLGELNTVQAFLHNDRYCTGMNKSIVEEYITKIEKI